MAASTHGGCGCSIYLDELMKAAHMCRNGNCLNCRHPVNAHPRRPAGKPSSHPFSDSRLDEFSSQLILWTGGGNAGHAGHAGNAGECSL